MTKGGKAAAPLTIDTTGQEVAHDDARQALVAADQLATLQAEADGNALALAKQIGYEGSLTVGSLEDEIRFFQRRTAEACLEMGKRLLLLKEMTPHGEFQQRLELLQIDHTMAKRFMTAAVKFAKGASTHLLKAANTQTKMLELLVLDDEEIEALEAGESARGITLDKIETMTVSELRAALRKAKKDSEAKDRVIEAKSKRNDALQQQLGRIEVEGPDETLDALRLKLSAFTYSVEAELAGKLLPACRALQDHHDAHGGDSREVLEGALRQVERMVNTVRIECGLGEI